MLERIILLDQLNVVFQFLYLILADLLLLGLQRFLVGQLALVCRARFLQLLYALLELTDLVLVALLLASDLALILLDLLKVLLLQVDDLLLLHLQFLIFLLNPLFKLTYLTLGLLFLAR